MNAAIPERRPVTEEISGLIERVTFHNEENGFCVLRVKARGQRDETTLIGSLPEALAFRDAGLTYRFSHSAAQYKLSANCAVRQYWGVESFNVLI